MRLATAMVVAALLAWAGQSARAASGFVNTRLDTGIAWYLDKPQADAPLYPGFHAALNADGRVYGRLHALVAGSIDAYRYGPDQSRSELFMVRGGPAFLPVEFDGGTGFVEATAGYANLHGTGRFAVVAGLGYMAQYGRLGIGLFSHYSQVMVPAGHGHDVKSLVFGVAAGVALLRPARAAAPGSTPPADEDGDGVADDKDKCPHTRKGARVGEDGCVDKPKVAEAAPAKPPNEEPKPPLETKAESPAPAPPAPPPSDDDDQDGVPNGSDACPGTTRGFPVDVVSGCALLRARFALPQVTFAPLTARPMPEAKAQLDELVALLRDRPGARLRITAYLGKADDMPVRVLKRLAGQRAQVVRELLLARGLAAKRVKAVGASKPDVDEIEIVVSGSTKLVLPKSPKANAPAAPASRASAGPTPEQLSPPPAHNPVAPSADPEPKAPKP